ncbi:hypothetical protein RUM44_004386 [Polyplax serrata]|uniref:PDZ domain-containing protein n=1 Tax=Polyplax serrata TaxID=468196 RepID=A0ABR1B2P1_POLSC
MCGLVVDDIMANELNGNLTAKPVVRLCHLVKWPDYDGYGFNLHANMNKPGQFIGNVEEGSPAQAAGLKEGDRIVEVNGANINGEVHKQVVSRIKQNPNETKLLVVDKESSEYFQANNITITSAMPEVGQVVFLRTKTKTWSGCAIGKSREEACHPRESRTGDRGANLQVRRLDGGREKKTDDYPGSVMVVHPNHDLFVKFPGLTDFFQFIRAGVGRRLRGEPPGTT